MRILDLMAKQLSEYHNGRINVFPNCWVWPNQAPKNTEIDRVRSIDATGRTMVLVHRVAVTCPNPAVGTPYPQTSAKLGAWSVPLKDCQACVHHRKPRRGVNYRHCEYARRLRGGNDGARSAAIEMVATAQAEAQAIVQGHRNTPAG